MSPLRWLPLALIGALVLAAPAQASDAEALLRDYREAKDVPARIACATKLGQDRSDAGVAALTVILEQDPHEGVRLAAAQGLLVAKSHPASLVLIKAATRWDPWLADLVVDGLGRGVLPQTKTWLLEKGLAHDREDIRVVSVRVLSKASLADSLKKLRVMSEDKATRVRAVVATALGADPVKSYRVLKRLAGDGSIRVRVAALAAIADSPKAMGVLKKAARADKAWQVRVEAIRALAKRAPAKFRPTFVKLAKDKKLEWRARRAAVQALARVPEAKAVDDLIELMRVLEGRLRAEARRSLQLMTGQRDLVAAEDWKNWWGARREGFAFVKLPGLDAAPLPAPPAKELPKTRARFYGLAVESQLPCFVIDCSGSMSEPAKAPPVARNPGKGTQERVDPAKKWTKFEVAKFELARALQDLPPGSRFGVLLFRERLVPLQEKPVPATKREIRRVLSLLSEIKPQGGTDVYTALTAILHGSEPRDPLAADKVDFDTLYLLSDGLPTTGPVTEPLTIRRRVEVFNRLAQVEIHTVAIGDAKNGSFLEKLASESGGRCVKR